MATPGGRGGKSLPGMRPAPGRPLAKRADKSAAGADTAEHAREVRQVTRGRDIVDKAQRAAEQRPAGFQHADMLVVRSWMQRRPLEGLQPAAALVAFPRMWSTKRGRFCRFVAPGAGSYGLLRARPTF